MRAIAATLVLVYAALAVAGPVVHAAEASQRLVPAVEQQHGAGCSAGHDPATCPLAHLGRATPLTPPAAHALTLPPTQAAPCSSHDGEVKARITASPLRARAPPLLLFG